MRPSLVVVGVHQAHTSLEGVLPHHVGVAETGAGHQAQATQEAAAGLLQDAAQRASLLMIEVLDAHLGVHPQGHSREEKKRKRSRTKAKSPSPSRSRSRSPVSIRSSSPTKNEKNNSNEKNVSPPKEEPAPIFSVMGANSGVNNGENNDNDESVDVIGDDSME